MFIFVNNSLTLVGCNAGNSFGLGESVFGDKFYFIFPGSIALCSTPAPDNVNTCLTLEASNHGE